MKLRDRPSTATAVDGWIRLSDAEFGVGGATASLRRLAPLVRQLLDTPMERTSILLDLGYALAQDNHDLSVAIRSLELLAEVSRHTTTTELNSRSAVVHVTNGWNAGVLNRSDPVHESLTPLPFFTHLVQQHYVETEHRAVPASKAVVLVVVDVQHLVGNRLELVRVRAAIVRHLQTTFSTGQPVSEGVNGNLVAMVERGPQLLENVAQLRRAMAADLSLAHHPLHVWIEPLADDGIHLESHLDGLLGHTAPVVWGVN